MIEPLASAARMEYRPELLSRRGEYIAWGTALLVIAAWLIMYLTRTPVFGGLRFLAILLALCGMAISLGNWMDRRTILRLEPDSVWFDNGLRQVSLHWSEIRQVQVYPSAWGKKVRVIGDKVHFDFRTLGEVILQGEVKGRMGFEKGEQILGNILKSAGLKQVPGPDNGSYYARE
jgi:hypothetical protein